MVYNDKPCASYHGFVTKAEEWKYSSALDYYGGKGLLEIIMLDTLIV